MVGKQEDKNSRKDALKRWKEEQRRKAREKFPLTDLQFQDLFQTLDEKLTDQGCDHTLQLTNDWIQANGVDQEVVVEWLMENGGCCDCEVLSNSEQAWEEAREEL